nr:hypothetical protein [Tanacetum cinerariifolium]
MILGELHRLNDLELNYSACGCQLHKSCGLPCEAIPLDSIDIFWRTLDVSRSTPLEHEDIQCDDELYIFKETFNKQSNAGKKSLLRRLGDIINPSTNLIREPMVKKYSWTTKLEEIKKNKFVYPKCQDPGIRSYSTRLFGIDLNMESARLNSYSNYETCVPNVFSDLNEEPARHSSYVSQSFAKHGSSTITSDSERFLRHLPQIFHPYLTGLLDVRGEENCEFHSVAVALGLSEDQSPQIRSDLVRELEANHQNYKYIFGTTGYKQLYKTVRFAGKWMEMPNTRLIIASAYNRVVIRLANGGNVRGCTITFSLWSSPPQSEPHEIIVIAHVYGNHFIKAALGEGCPLSMTHPLWRTYRSDIESRWEDPYKFLEEFLCLVGLSRHYTLDEETYPLFLDKDEEDLTKVKVVERERKEDEPRLLETIVGRIVPLLPVVPDRNESELDVSVDKLFDEGGSGAQTEQRDSAGGGGERLKKRKTIVADAGEPSPSVPILTATTTITLSADPAVVVKEKIVEPSLFAAESTFAGGTDPAMAGLTDLTDSDFLWNVTNGSRLDDDGVFREMVDEFAPTKFFASVRGMEHDQLFTEEYRRLKYVVEEKDQLLKARDEEVENLKAQLLLKEAEATKAIRLRAETSKLETAEKSLRDEVNALNERNSIFEKERNALDANVKVTDLYVLLDLGFFFTYERFYPHLFTSIARRRWLLTYGMELAVAKCLNSPEYLSALGKAISKAIEKGMQDGLAVGINHGKKGRVLTNVAAHNPFAEAYYVFALQQLQGVNFPLLAELKANKDASIEVVINILLLEEHLAERLSLNESQPYADQLMVPIHQSLDKTVVGDSAISLALDVSDARVRRIRENIMSHMSLFHDVFIPLAEPFSATAVTGMEGTSGTVPAIVDTTATLFVTFASASIVDPKSIDDYEVTGTDDQPIATKNVPDGNASLFPNVDDTELNIP